MDRQEEVIVALVASVFVAAVGALVVRRAHDHIVEHLDRHFHHLGAVIVTATQDVVDAVVAQLDRARGEIVARIAEVQAQLDAAGVPAESVDLSALSAAAQALDDIVPDVPEVPAEVPAEVVGDPVEDGGSFDA